MLFGYLVYSPSLKKHNMQNISTLVLKPNTNYMRHLKIESISITFKSLAFSYFSLSLCPFKVLLAARNTYLNSFWLMGSFQ